MIAQLDKEYFQQGKLKSVRRIISYFMEGRPLTTTGRWFNHLLFAFFFLIKNMPGIFTDVKGPVYIVGMGRSGTTILGRILSVHKDIGFLNEPKAMWHAIYPNEDISGNFTLKKSFYRLSGGNVSDRTIKYAKNLFGFYRMITFSKVIVDKFPEIIFRHGFIKKIFPGAKFIFLVRNGWDVSLSIENWSEKFTRRKNGNVEDWWGINNRKWELILDQLIMNDPQISSIYEQARGINSNCEKAAVEWLVTMREGKSLMEKFPQDVLLVKHEDLVVDPPGILKQIFDFLKMNNDPAVCNYAEKVLLPIHPKGKFKMNKKIHKYFIEILNHFGYE